ncbi:MAG: T9SS type A sorting domain-containing protein [Lacibacter sp.]
MKPFFLLAFMACAFHSNGQITLTTSPLNENFDGIAGGLPSGFFVQTGSGVNSTGTNATFTTAKTLWTLKNGGFYNCASATGLTNTATGTQQDNSTNRALSVRQATSFGNPGAAFVFKITNTTGKTNFRLNFRMMSLDLSSEGVSAWGVDYGIGANPSSFTSVVTSPTPVRTGAKSTTSNYKFITDVSVNFGTGLDNKSDIVWIRVWAPSAVIAIPTWNADPTMSAIDDWQLSWDTPASVSNISKELNNTKVVAGHSNGIQIQFNNASALKTSIRLTDLYGRILQEKQIARILQGQTETIQTGALPKGVYLINIQNKSGIFTQKIVL